VEGNQISQLDHHFLAGNKLLLALVLYLEDNNSSNLASRPLQEALFSVVKQLLDNKLHHLVPKIPPTLHLLGPLEVRLNKLNLFLELLNLLDKVPYSVVELSLLVLSLEVELSSHQDSQLFLEDKLSNQVASLEVRHLLVNNLSPLIKRHLLRNSLIFSQETWMTS
jgi:hypothetical protein